MRFLVVIVIIDSLFAEFHCPNSHLPDLKFQLPDRWLNGSRNCFENKTFRHRNIDEFRMNNNTYILRQNKCLNYEAPFLFLLFSRKRILLIDSGATISSNSFPIQQHVERIIYYWCTKNKQDRKNMELIVAHTHNHLDHVSGDNQFQNRSKTTVVGTQLEDVIEFFQISDWPNSISTYKLDNQRHLAIIPIPGHEESSIAFYDCATGLLLTGDTFYPGRLYVSDFSAYAESISRLVDFIHSNSLNITGILGTHIEMTNKSQIDYPLGATYQPNEHSLYMSVDELEQLNNELQNQIKNGFHQRHKVYFDSFIFDPFPSQLPPLPADEHFSSHEFVLMPVDRMDFVWISYKPKFTAPIDYQLVFFATISNTTNDLAKFNHPYTIQSYEFSLNNFLNGNIKSFPMKLYFRANETYLDNIHINLMPPFLTISQLNLSHTEPYQPLRYLSYLSSNSIKTQIHLYFLHEIRVLPDFDAIVHGIIQPANCTGDIERKYLNELLERPGNQWAFHGLENDVFHRLTSASGQVRAQLLGDSYSTICTVQIIKEIQCKSEKIY